MKGNRINAEELGLWEGCRGGWFSRHAKCTHCGKAAADHRPAGGEASKLKRTDQHALVEAVKTASKLFPTAARLRIVITRGYQSTPLDVDNLVGGAKPLRDEIARLLGRDDAEHRGIIWEYRQEKGRIRKVEIYEETERNVNHGA